MSAKKEKIMRKLQRKEHQARRNVIEYKGWSVTAFFVQGLFENHFGDEAAPARRVYPYTQSEIRSLNGSRSTGRGEMLFRRLALFDELVAYDRNPSPHIMRRKHPLGAFNRRSGPEQLLLIILGILIRIGIVFLLGMLIRMVGMGLAAGL